MSLLAKINNFILTYLEVFKSLKRFSLWLPFFVYALFQVILLFILLSFTSPILAGVFVPLFKKMYGEAILHYPTFFAFLPAVFNRANLLVGLFLGIILDGAAFFMFCSYFTQKRFSFLSGIKVALSKYWMLLALGILKLPVILVMRIPFWLLRDMVTGSPRREFALEVGCIILGVIYTGIFVYATPAIIWHRKKLFRAIADSWSIFIGNFFSTFLFIFIPVLINFPVNFLKRQSPTLVTKFSPEIVAWVVVLGVIVSILANFFSSGAVAKFYLGEEVAE